MTPIYHSSLGSSSASPFPAKFNEDQTVHQFLTPSSQVASSSINSSLSYHVFFNSNTHDPSGYFHREQQQQQQDQGDNIGGLQAYDGDHGHVENKGNIINGKSTNNNGLKFSLWKKDVVADDQNDQVKWMSSKMRLMLKMKKPDDHPTDAINPPSTCATNNILLAPTEAKAIEQDHNSTINSSNNFHNNSNPIIRVCSDCNTTKTPLWRSGPRGPKSLCNACGIRQRKARRAAAAAAAAAAESGLTTPANQATMPMKSTKLQNKDHKKQNTISGHVTKYKKKQYCKTIAAAPMVATPASSGVVASPERNNCFEDFLVSLSKNLAFHRVFPQDEKEAAILLMAISCGYIHG